MLSWLDLGISWSAGDPKAAAFVPTNLQRTNHAERFIGEEIHRKAVPYFEAGHLFRNRESGRIRARRSRRKGRGRRTTSSERANCCVGMSQQGLELLQFLDKRRAVGRSFGKGLGVAIAECESPVHAAPCVEPQAILFHNGETQRFTGCGSRTERLRNDSAN